MLEAAEGDLELRLDGHASTATSSTLDFTGSADQHDGNLNCPLAVTLSACYFALRVLPTPTCRPARAPTGRSTVIAPEGSLLNARAARRGGRPATWRPPRAWPTSCWPRSAARSARAR